MSEIPNEPTEPAPPEARSGGIASFEQRRRQSPKGPVLNRVPPHNLSAEESLIGAMLLSKDAVWAAIDITEADDFYKPAYGHVYQSIVDLAAAGEPVDVVTVADHLGRQDLLDAVGGAGVLTDLQGNTPAINNADRYAAIVAEHATLRRLIGVAGEISEVGYAVPEDVAAAIDEAEALLFRVTDPRRRSLTVNIHDAVGEFLDRLAELYDQGDQTIGITTGFIDLDKLIYGWEPRQFTIVGARPGMGKSAIAGAFTTNAAAAGAPVLVMSAEMSHEELTQRFMAAATGVDLDRLKRGTLADRDWNLISRAVGQMAEVPIEICDDALVTLMTVRAHARRVTRKYGTPPLVIVDYMQLMTPLTKSENRNIEISEISRGLKKLSGELELPVVGLSQLSRNLESRRDKRPVLSDLRDSGSLEQDADKVLFLYRDEVYNSKTKDKGVMEVIVAKHRNGPSGIARLAYEPHRSRFRDMVRSGA